LPKLNNFDGVVWFEHWHYEMKTKKTNKTTKKNQKKFYGKSKMP
jgi:hypothetical protein